MNFMKLKTILVLNAMVGACSGLTAILLGEKVLSMYGVDSNPSAVLMGQYSALGTLAMASVAWFARNIEDMKAQRAIILSFLITSVLGVIISLSGIISGVMKKGWITVGIYLIFAIGYGYFQFFKRGDS
jgi:hypothetical protein